jgi:glycosyltransferase involved in cell wall biosynthesis
MKFAIITHAVHKLKDQKIYAYEPYVREMNLWLKYVDEVEIIAPVSNDAISSIESKYQFKDRHCEHSEAISSKEQIATSQTPRNDEQEKQNALPSIPCNEEIKLIPIPSFDITSIKNGIKAIFRIPKIFGQIYKAMQWADHIHLRCPGNVGLLGCFVQVLFPKKPKTIKYAGNWDLKSKQPLSYRLQKWIVSSTFLTKNTKVLVYGDWPNQSKNIVPFFTASYSEEELQEKQKSLRQAQIDNAEEQIATSRTPRNDENNSHPDLVEGFDDKCIHFLFVGALTKGKQPLLSVKVVHELKKKGYNVQLNMYGEGSERNHIEQYIQQNQLSKTVILHGNAPKNIVKNAYKKAQFLLFISKSEGWPKVVAEAMFWGCLPISSNVSCIPYMLGNGSRGTMVNTEIKEIVSVIEDYLEHNEKYAEHVKEAIKWSRQYTLEKFEKEIKSVLLSF